MLCPALLMAWLATMPKQLSTFSEWALTTLVPAVFLLLEACNAPNPGPAQLGACLALVHGLGQGQPGKRPRSVWSIRQVVGGGKLLAQASQLARMQARMCTQLICTACTQLARMQARMCTQLICTARTQLAQNSCAHGLHKAGCQPVRPPPPNVLTC